MDSLSALSAAAAAWLCSGEVAWSNMEVSSSAKAVAAKATTTAAARIVIEFGSCLKIRKEKVLIRKAGGCAGVDI